MWSVATVLVLAIGLVVPGASFESTPSRQPAESLTVAFTGDILVHLSVARAAARLGDPYDFGPLFDPVRHILSRVDLAICHLETPLSRTGAISSFPVFNSPPEIAQGLAHAGYDGCSTASNHSFDQGVVGISDTIEVLDAAGLQQAGMAQLPKGSGKAAMYRIGDMTLGHISGTFSLNGFRVPASKSWLVQMLDADQMIRSAERAKAAGADLVVASVHCCVEYARTPTQAQLEFAHQLVESPFIDLVVTHHSHVVAPIEKVGDEFIAHGLGNCLSGQTQRPVLADGVILVARATSNGNVWRFSSLEVVPTVVTRGSYQVMPAAPDSDSYQRTMTTLEMMGADVGLYRVPGLTPSQLRLIE